MSFKIGQLLFKVLLPQTLVPIANRLLHTVITYMYINVTFYLCLERRIYFTEDTEEAMEKVRKQRLLLQPLPK